MAVQGVGRVGKVGVAAFGDDAEWTHRSVAVARLTGAYTSHIHHAKEATYARQMVLALHALSIDKTLPLYVLCGVTPLDLYLPVHTAPQVTRKLYVDP